MKKTRIKIMTPEEYIVDRAVKLEDEMTYLKDKIERMQTTISCLREFQNKALKLAKYMEVRKATTDESQEMINTKFIWNDDNDKEMFEFVKYEIIGEALPF